MKNVENELKELILDRYGNLSEFCKKIDLPWTTLDSILKRGVDKANIKNILKITAELNIDVESLANGQIVSKDVSK
jgi:predicted transcriptional regulator